nr:multimerin-2 isoform X2 [Geotrypetes seraphini]XP_033796102.1 multimerin-2 isoform X2 [Geotrypetes seraphini]
MYRLALKPVYKVKQKVVTSLEWKCCPGYTGVTCEHNDPNAIQVPVSPARGMEGEQASRPSTYAKSTEIKETIYNQESLLEDLQNDIHQATANLKALEENITIIYKGNTNKSNTEDQLLQHVLLPYIENFLREHFKPMWTNFNKSLQDLSGRVQNLSQNVEANRESIEKFQETMASKKDLQEMGSKFESKIQENIDRVDQLKQNMDNHLHLQKSGIHYNLTMVKDDTDIELKRNHKIHQSHFAFLSTSLADIKREQENLQDETQTLARNITELWLYHNTKDGAPKINAYKINETLAAHAKQIKNLNVDSLSAFEDISTLDKWINDLRTQLKTAKNEYQISLIEKSLIIEENKDELQKQLIDLNYTIIGLEERNQDLLDYIKNCECQRLSSDISILEEDQRNITSHLKEIILNLEELNQTETNSKKALQNSVEDLSMVLQSIYQSLASQQEQGRIVMYDITQFKDQMKNFSDDVLLLKKEDEEMNNHIKDLHSFFNSLLEDTSRHDRALVALLGDDIIEVLSEENPEALKMSIFEMHEILNGTSKNFEKQNAALEVLKKRILVLEMQNENSDSPESSSTSNLGNQIKIISEDSISKQDIPEHMEPNHEGTSDDVLDNSVYNDILTLKKDIKYFSMKIKHLEMLCPDGNFCCNNTLLNLIQPLNGSVEMLRVDLQSVKQLFEEQHHLFQKLFGSNDELIASNISLDITKFQTFIMKTMKRHQRAEEQHKVRDKKQTGEESMYTGTLSKESKLREKLFTKDSSVAFYVGFSEGTNQAKILRFNELYLNYGEGYVPEGGYFKAPYNGVYMFAIYVEFGHGPALGQLVLGNQQRIMLHSNKKKQSNEGLTRFAVVKLKKAEMVWFELMQGSVIKKIPPGTAMGGVLVFKT